MLNENYCGTYILKDKVPIPEPDVFKWAEWFERDERVVDSTRIGQFRVSTVFLGLDHNFMGGRPILFETMIFGSDKTVPIPELFKNFQERYHTWDEAESGHKKACKMVELILGASS